LPAKNRRKAREAVLGVLYEVEVGKADPQASMGHLEAFEELSEDLGQYARELVAGIFERRDELDRIIVENLKGYDLQRIAAVDRNLLRIAVYELFHRPEVPPRVTLDEAIELAKKYSTAESGKFVNGVLAAVLERSPKKHWSPPENVVEEEPPPAEPEPEIEEVRADGEEAEELAKVGKWTLKVTEDRE
jgi:N utilization substance protein B